MTRSIPSLQKSEWIIFFTIVALIVSVFIIAKQSSFRGLEQLRAWERKEASPEIWVEVGGHVRRPGKYRLRSGVALENAIRKAGPKAFADLSAIDVSEVPKESCYIEIQPCQTIRIRVVGCVKEMLDLELDPGCRISDLKGKVEVTPEADRAFFRKRRILQNGEVVEIPHKCK